MARTIPAEVHTAARTAADRPVPAIQQISSVASGIAAPMRIGSSRSIVASSPRAVSLAPDRSRSPARSA